MNRPILEGVARKMIAIADLLYVPRWHILIMLHARPDGCMRRDVSGLSLHGAVGQRGAVFDLVRSPVCLAISTWFSSLILH